jgi:Sulfotransferase domain
MGRYAHITRAKNGSQWVKDVLSDPRILAAQGLRFREPSRDNAMQAFGREADGTLVAPLFRVTADDWLAHKRPGDRCVVVLRDPRDTVVSWAFSMAYSHVAAGRIAIVRPAVLALDLRGKLEVAAYGFMLNDYQNRSWAQHGSTACALVCRFEDLLDDELCAFRSMIDHFGWDVSDALLREVVEPLTFERRSGGRARGEKDEYSHFRNAVPGDWRNYFERDLAERFEGASPGLLRVLGYESSDDWWKQLPEKLPALGARDVPRALADDLAGALADRDRRASELQRQADERLAVIDRISREAATLSAQLTATAAENEQLRNAAQERLELLEANDHAYAHFKSQLTAKLAELCALGGAITP